MIGPLSSEQQGTHTVIMAAYSIERVGDKYFMARLMLKMERCEEQRYLSFSMDTHKVG
jgi:hypothetical protein